MSGILKCCTYVSEIACDKDKSPCDDDHAVQANYFLMGWGLTAQHAAYYHESMDIIYSCVLVFTVVGPLAFVSYQYRLGIRSFWGAFSLALSWTPFMAVFFT